MASHVRTAISAIMAGITLAGCAAVGPDFHSPKAPGIGSYTAAELPDRTVVAQGAGGAAQRFVSGLDIPQAWWRLFRSEPLDRLVRLALVDSPTLALAQARIREARENRRAQFGALYPSLDVNASATRQKISGALFGQPDTGVPAFTLLNASVNVSYSPDLFGGTRRQIEALDAQIEYQQFQLEGAHLTLTASIVTTAVKEASLRLQLQVNREIAALLARELELVERRLRIGGASLADVLAQRTQLAQTEAALPPLERDLEQTRHQLAVLVGKLPGEAALPGLDLDEINLPEDVPVSMPSSLVRQRPDIRAAEALLHSAGARVGVATANLYPRITLTGSIGAVATTGGGLFDSTSSIWSLGAGLLQPVFHGGTLTAQRRAVVAQYDQAAAQYRETVLESFQNVADVLRALESDARSLRALAEAEMIARNALDLTRKQFEAGAVNYLLLLNAQRQYQEARLGVVGARAARLADTAALFQAMGGGWWNRPAREEPTTQE
jgi:NodT family efflux transporter outer membrane factor (OMF) lipoprotein